MATVLINEVTIDAKRCFGCGFCVQFCPKRYLEQNVDKIGHRGYAIPQVIKPGQCTACGACVQMCPHWAIAVNSYSGVKDGAKTLQKVIGPPELAQDPPFAGCAGCQHPTVGRIIAEVIEDSGLEDRVYVIDDIPCSTSSAFGTDLGHKCAHDEAGLDLAAITKRRNPDMNVIAVEGYWGMSDFSLNMNSFINALIRGDNITVILCNTPYYGPRDGRPVPVGEPIEGKLDPVTRIVTPDEKLVLKGGYPPRFAEMVATFEGVAFSARSTVVSPKYYQTTKKYIKTALQKQLEKKGLSFVEVLCICCDPTYSAPIKCLNWIEQKMIPAFPPGEYKNRA